MFALVAALVCFVTESSYAQVAPDPRVFETIFLEDIKHFTDRDVIATTGLETGVATRLTFNGRQRLTPGGLAIRTTFELGDCVGLGRDNPRISERFTLGGANLRGFERSTNSPRDTCLSCAPGGGNFVTILSGHYYAVARTDLLVPIFKKLPQLETFAFFDIGSVWDEQTNTPAAGILDDGADLCMSYGIGTSFDTGLGKFEAYLALGSEGEVFDEEQDLARLSELNFRGN